ncbi:MAG: class I SAM-dependent methyltransferase [archaeon]
MGERTGGRFLQELWGGKILPVSAQFKKTRGFARALADFLTFPLRALTLFHSDLFFLSSLASERFYYVAAEVEGVCLDVGCGRGNRFVSEFLGGNGEGVDVFPYEGLNRENLVKDLSRFPFKTASFGTVTFIANINHVPKKLRDKELSEAFRCLRIGGKIAITMGNPLAEIAVHKVVHLYDRFLGTHNDLDGERGMDEIEEAFFLTDAEIVGRLKKAGFSRIRKRYFVTQWFLNHMFIADKSRDWKG